MIEKVEVAVFDSGNKGFPLFGSEYVRRLIAVLRIAYRNGTVRHGRRFDAITVRAITTSFVNELV